VSGHGRQTAWRALSCLGPLQPGNPHEQESPTGRREGNQVKNNNEKRGVKPFFKRVEKGVKEEKEKINSYFHQDS
jgi:hypothetical protein